MESSPGWTPDTSPAGWCPGRGRRLCELPVQAREYCFSLRADGLAGKDTGLLREADDPLDLMRQADRFGVAEGDGQHIGCGVLVSGPGQSGRWQSFAW